MREYEVLVMEDRGGVPSFVHQRIPEDRIPSGLNGGSGAHICQVRALTEALARELAARSDRYSLTEAEIQRIALASTLHDVGKTRIPREVLEKHSALTPMEFEIVKRHPVLGSGLIAEYGAPLEDKLRSCAWEIALCHHERYDGGGYPQGLSGDEIPIAAQIVSVADACDALVAERSYKKAIPPALAVEMISRGMCGAFHPLLLECLIRCRENWL